MRPDFDDFDDIDNGQDESRSRLMSWLVLGVVVIGFAALAHYAYRSGTSASSEGDMLVVQADGTPIKQIPADPDGEKFPNQDKTIYDVIAPQAKDQKVEKMLPEPERAMLPSNDGDISDDDTVAAAPVQVAQPVVQPSATVEQTTTFVKSSEKSNPPVPVKEGAKKIEPVKLVEKPTEKPAAVENPALKPVVAETLAETPAVKENPSEEIIGAPTMVNEKPVLEAKEEKPQPTEVKQVPVAEVKLAKPSPAKPASALKSATSNQASTGAEGGVVKIQLGAYKSQEEAEAAWKKMKAKFGATLPASPLIIKAELASGTFYRLRAGSFATADAAKAVCAKVTAQGQACIPAGK